MNATARTINEQSATPQLSADCVCDAEYRAETVTGWLIAAAYLVAVGLTGVLVGMSFTLGFFLA